jgi:hypothetical protein
MTKKRRVYEPRIVGDKVMMPADLKRLHKYMLDIERVQEISDEMRAVVVSERPELAHKLPRRRRREPKSSFAWQTASRWRSAFRLERLASSSISRRACLTGWSCRTFREELLARPT